MEPQTRKSRQAQMFKEDKERERLSNRKESYYSYEAPAITPYADAANLSYNTESERFNKDSASHLKQERDAAFERKESMYYGRRMKNSEIESERWEKIESRHKTEEKRLDDHRKQAAVMSSNKTSMPYDPITLQYDVGEDGTRLKYSDDVMQHRSRVRAHFLQAKQTSTGYDPITGNPIPQVHVPHQPSRPF